MKYLHVHASASRKQTQHKSCRNIQQVLGIYITSANLEWMKMPERWFIPWHAVMHTPNFGSVCQMVRPWQGSLTDTQTGVILHLQLLILDADIQLQATCSLYSASWGGGGNRKKKKIGGTLQSPGKNIRKGFMGKKSFRKFPPPPDH